MDDEIQWDDSDGFGMESVFSPGGSTTFSFCIKTGPEVQQKN